MSQSHSIFVSFHPETTPIVGLFLGNDLLGMWNGTAAEWTAEALKVALPDANIICDTTWHNHSKEWWIHVKTF